MFMNSDVAIDYVACNWQMYFYLSVGYLRYKSGKITLCSTRIEKKYKQHVIKLGSKLCLGFVKAISENPR